jgi:hypothetical protein
MRARALFLLTSTACLFAAPSRAQTYLDNDNEIIFDDFVYTDATSCSVWEGTCDPDGGTGNGTTDYLFGTNPWVKRGGTVQDRAWYRYSWAGLDHGDEAAILPTPEDGAGDPIVQDAGVWIRMEPEFEDEDRDPQLTSGFVRRTGSWFARVKLEDVGRTAEDFIQAFWAYSPHAVHVDDQWQARRQHGTEFDHEWNNFFGGLNATAPTAGQIYDNTAARLEDPDATDYFDNPRPLPHRAHEWAGPYTCRLSDWLSHPVNQGDPVMLPRQCIGAFLENLDGRDQWVILSMHFDGSHVEFTVTSITDGSGAEQPGSVYMNSRNVLSSDDEPVYPPSQGVTTIFSMHLSCRDTPATGQDCVLEMPFTLEADWFYYSSDPEANLYSDVLDHIADIRAADVRRLHLEPLDGSGNPLPTPLKADIGNHFGTWGLGTQVPPVADNTWLRADLVTPPEYQVGSLAPNTWTVRPHNTDGTTRSTAYKVEWRMYEKYNDSTPDSAPTSYSNGRGGLTRRYLPSGPNVSEICVRARITDVGSVEESATLTNYFPTGGYATTDNEVRWQTDYRCYDPTPSGFAASTEAAVPETYAFRAPAPNPAADGAQLRFAVPEPADVRFEVYDALGRRVARLAEVRYEPGEHEVTLETGGLAGGVYVVQMTAGGFQHTHRFTVAD